MSKIKTFQTGAVGALVLILTAAGGAAAGLGALPGERSVTARVWSVQASGTDAVAADSQKQALRAFVLGDYLGQDRDGQSERPNLYAERVQYYKRGVVPRRHVIEDRTGFKKRWTKREFKLVEDSFVVEAGPADTVRASFRFEFEFANNRETVRGTADTRLGLRLIDGQYTIVQEEGEVHRRPTP